MTLDAKPDRDQQSHRPHVAFVQCRLASAAILCLGGFWIGCNRNASSPILPSDTSSTATKSVILAEGQILPAGGIVQLASAPGDIVEEMLVQVGDLVSAGQELATLRSAGINATRMERLRQAKLAAEADQALAVQTARRQVAAAELKLSQLESQQSALERNSELLALAAEQVAASRQVLQRLRSISNNALTSEFVGQLEIDRQQLAVGEAELSYRQKQEAQRQAEEDLLWARRVAESQLEAAGDALAAAESSEAVKLIELEQRTLEKQISAAEIRAPLAGVVLAVNAGPGETSPQRPLIELANLDSLVCEVEVNEMDASQVQPGQPATIFSRAFNGKPLSGVVQSKSRLVGRPQLKPLDPLARADFRSVTAIVQLDQESAERAKNWLQLQVEVRIDTESMTAHPVSSGGEPPAES